MRGYLALVGCLVAATPGVRAESFAWAENIGFLNLDATTSSSVLAGAAYSRDHLSGFVWSEAAGWISLGVTGVPGPYSNTSGLDYGINIDVCSGRLGGFAWGENIGWVNFGPFLEDVVAPDGSSPAQARLGYDRWFGYAWGENIGWINFDDQSVIAAIPMPLDITRDGVTDGLDLLAYLDLVFGSCGRADVDEDQSVDAFDVSLYLSSLLG
ncbi:MAG: hypothetical protein AAGI30_08125 [Planctomycetota bacterium]